MTIIQKIKQAKLCGRGGASFPTADKWQMVKDAKAERKFIVCNASEGEPGIKKDFFLLENRPEIVIGGIRIALEFLQAEKAYLYLNPEYFKLLASKLKNIIGTYPIEVFAKAHDAGYVGGEESSALNHIENRRVEPRLKPPFPPVSGLWGCPTLINNVETFYAVYLINEDSYKNTRFYTVGGDCVYDGVYELADGLSIAEVLHQSNNYPDFPFFVQVGGDMSGQVLNSSQLDAVVNGSASVTIHSLLKHNPMKLMRAWAEFYCRESCGQCVPCREGTYRLREELTKNNLDWDLVLRLLDDLEESSFCGLGLSVKTPFKSYFDNVYSGDLRKQAF